MGARQGLIAVSLAASVSLIAVSVAGVAAKLLEFFARLRVPTIQSSAVRDKSAEPDPAAARPAASEFVAVSVADAGFKRDADFVGTVCFFDFMETAMKRADRSAAAASLTVSVLDRSDKGEILALVSPALLLLPATRNDWRRLTDVTLDDKLRRGRSLGVWRCSTSGGGGRALLALLFAFDSDEQEDAQGRTATRHYACFVPSHLDSTSAAAALLAFATRATVAAPSPTRCVVATGPFRADGGSGRDVEPRLSTALAASNFTRRAGPALRVYRRQNGGPSE